MRRWIGLGLAGVVVLALLAGLAGWFALRRSLPPLDGEHPVAGLSAPATIARDALGIVTIEAGSRVDAMRALGVVHAQERYFEMDLMRRSAAGELAGLFGVRALEHDRDRRVHRMRARATAHLDRILGPHRADVQAYVDGVNAGLGLLGARPWPYLLLGAEPAPWTLEDPALVGFAMYFDLQDEDNARELALWRVRPHLPPALHALLSHDGSSWDAPLQGEARGDAALPGPAELDLRSLPAPAPGRSTTGEPPFARGSNNFAVSGALTEHGAALVADDMHLGLRAPNIWFRVRLRYPDARAPGGRVDVTGFSLPGLPGVVVGSNGHVAWGFTNSYGDWADWRVEPGCAGACTAARTHVETIEVADADPVRVEVRETGWGPLMHATGDGDGLALRWAAHLPGALDLGLMDFAHAGSLQALFDAADAAAIPAQNLVAGDRDGRIGWRLLGPMPAGARCDVDRPSGIAVAARTGVAGAGCAPWALVSNGNPEIVDPRDGRLWTANARVVDGGALAAIGDGGYVNGVRAWMIRDRLAAGERFDARDLLEIQLDDRALFLERWWDLMRAQARANGTPALAALAAADDAWPRRAAGDSASYRIARAWRRAVHARIADGLLAPARAALGPDTPMPELPQLEGVAWPIASQRPAHLLPKRFDSWAALFEDAAREVRDELARRGPLAERTWAERNTARICHPLAGAIPVIGVRMLCMPREPLAGDTLTPRAQSPDAGASQRMVVAPGHEADGIAHMPGGQSGHPLSPFWGAGHDDWVHGRPTPFLPGDTVHVLRLVP
jgi:penicillin amidase